MIKNANSKMTMTAIMMRMGFKLYRIAAVVEIFIIANPDKIQAKYKKIKLSTLNSIWLPPFNIVYEQFTLPVIGLKV